MEKEECAKKEDKRVSEEGLSGGRMVEDNKNREKVKTVDQKKKDERRQSTQQKRGKRVRGEGLPGVKTVKVDDRRERGHSVRQERSFADVVSQGKARKAPVCMGDSIIKKVDKIVNIGDDITVCLPGAKIEDIAEKAGQVMVVAREVLFSCMWERTMPRRRERQPSLVSTGVRNVGTVGGWRSTHKYRRMREYSY